MRQTLLHAALTIIALLFFCIEFPAASGVAAYIVQHAAPFAACWVLAFLVSRRAAIFWWAEHIQLKGVGSKSRWQRQHNQGVTK